MPGSVGVTQPCYSESLTLMCAITYAQWTEQKGCLCDLTQIYLGYKAPPVKS